MLLEKKKIMSILFDDNEDIAKRTSGSSVKRSMQDSNYNATAKKYDKLLVFGYHCKFFRDDEMAVKVNEGKTLIPWMGNQDLMIDRYYLHFWLTFTKI